MLARPVETYDLLAWNVLSHGTVVFEGPVDEAIAVYMQEEMTNQTFFDATHFKRDHKCNLRHLVQSSEILESEKISDERGILILLSFF